VALTPQMMSPVPTIPSTVRPIPSDHGIQQEEDLVEVRIVRGSFEERGNYFIGMRILGYPGKVRTETVKETNEPEWGNYKAEFAIPANEGAKLTPNTKLVLEFGCFFSSKVMPRPTLIGVHQLYLDTVAPQLLYGKTVPIVATFCNAKDTVGTVSVLMYYPHADKFSLALGFDRLQVCESFHSRVYSLRKLNEVMSAQHSCERRETGHVNTEEDKTGNGLYYLSPNSLRKLNEVISAQHSCETRETGHVNTEEDKTGNRLNYLCPICLELLIEPLALPSCSHLLCKQCCTKLLGFKDHCPLCRKEIPKSFNPKEAAIDIECQQKVLTLFSRDEKVRKYNFQVKHKVPGLRIEYGNSYYGLHETLGTQKDDPRAPKQTSVWNTTVAFFSSTNKTTRLRNTEFVKSVTFDFVKHYPTTHGVHRFRGKQANGYFCCEGKGNGSFDYEIRIKFADELRMRPLCFFPTMCESNGGKMFTVELDLSPEQAYLLGLVDTAMVATHYYAGLQMCGHEHVVDVELTEL